MPLKKTFPLNRLIACCCCLLLLSSFVSLKTTGQHPASKKRTSVKAQTQKTFYGQASFYSDKFNGRRTSSGEIFKQSKMTCACNGLPMGTWVRVTNLKNDKSAIVKVNDRLHPSMKRVVDLTSAAAKKLGFTAAGLTRVRVEVLGKSKPA